MSALPWATVAAPGPEYDLSMPDVEYHRTRAAAREYASWVRRHPGTRDVRGSCIVLRANEVRAYLSGDGQTD